MQDHASPQRLLVGHDASISAIAWHPNGTYVFSASDETDKSIRMWSVVTGACVRVFTGHTDYVSALECSPDGRMLASGDAGGNIFFWDLAKGTRLKRSRGHGKGGIWSLSFSVESNVLVSGGHDGTVRLWDVELPADGSKAAAVQQQQAQQQQQLQQNQSAQDGGADSIVAATPGGQSSTGTGLGTAATTAGQGQVVVSTAGTAGGVVSSSSGGGGGGGGGGSGPGGHKKKGKEVMITPDQISAFATKKTPVLKVHFTRMNLIVAGGCYDPDR
jgi:transcription initiation factor TFIID subunit 5